LFIYFVPVVLWTKAARQAREDEQEHYGDGLLLHAGV